MKNRLFAVAASVVTLDGSTKVMPLVIKADNEEEAKGKALNYINSIWPSAKHYDYRVSTAEVPKEWTSA